jgi:hypothetical protein
MKFEIEAHVLLNRVDHRVYFADFYCNNTTPATAGVTAKARSEMESGKLRPHYITLVVCKRDSKSDK